MRVSDRTSRRALLRAIAVAYAATRIGTPSTASASPVLKASPARNAPTEVLTHLPGDTNTFALTVDDGVDTEVVAAYAEFSRATNTRLTFFVNGVNESWTTNAPILRPLVESGQIQLANHTWSHPSLLDLTANEVSDEIGRNAAFLQNTYGVDGTPFFRPPFGRHDDETDALAADLGYTSIVLWSSSLEDWQLLDEPTLMANADNSFTPNQIVLAHANWATITRCFDPLSELIRSRGLQAVTLHDVFTD